MPASLKDKMKGLSAARRKKVETRVAALIAEEMSLRDLRRAHELTQERVGEFLGIGQDGVSRLEKRSDLLISTPRSYIEAMGGRLNLVAELPDRPPVLLSGLREMEPVTKDARKLKASRSERR